MLSPPSGQVPAVSPSQREMQASEDAQMRHASFRPGSIIADKYVVERVIGEGGLGVVVAARHQNLDQTVAIKYLRPKVLGAKVVIERFLREARLAAKIRSEHVVRVYDVGTLPEGMPYMVMEYLAGTDLGQVLTASGPLPVERAVDCVLQACEALAEAHVSGIVHRDLKPDNLFLATGTAGKSVVKVLDFGISKLTAKRSETGRLSELTEANDQFGTPVYMSPEQLRSAADVDARADVWAIGVILYELLTGHLPFEGAGLPELCTAILTRSATPLATARPYLPESMQAVIDRCLAKDRAERFQNVAELSQELRQFATASGRESIDHIVSIVREAGEQVRPSTPAPSDSLARAMREAMTIAPSEGRTAMTTSSGAASWGTMRTQPAVASSQRAKLAFVGAGATIAVAVAIGLAWIHGQSSPVVELSRNAAGSAQGIPATRVDPPAASVGIARLAGIERSDAPAPASPSSLAPPLAPSPADATAIASPPAVPSSSRNGSARPGNAGKTKGGADAQAAASASTAPAPTPFDPNAVINPFQ